MADNFLEKQYDEYDRRKAAREAARKKQWQRRLRAYQERLAGEKATIPSASPASEDTAEPEPEVEA